MESLRYFALLMTFSVFGFLGIISQDKDQEAANTFIGKTFYQRKSQLTRVEMKPDSRWIVVTSIQYPTEDIKKHASQLGWNLVVVADTKTPNDWSLTNVHFLSIQKQKELFGEFADLLPYHSYTRKNLGYLYAIMNGAEWIYDTDDDNKPYGLGLNQFDYNSPISGLRYVPKEENISTKLFNPYRFYGYENMWPRGFPLEYLEEHTNGRDRMVSCREMPHPAVQQGVVRSDPDVDAIYRLLHAQKGSGLNVTFNKIAPSIVLEKGTYSPWNSQNTLFHYKAFFILYLPSSVAFRVTDIWRSYFGQKLLHLIGENVAFYPTNAIQFRNAHNFLNDFHQEIDVYEQSGKIVNFLEDWECFYNETVECVRELADQQQKFFNQTDRNFIEAWLEQLTLLGYNFPPLSNETDVNEIGKKYGNCRTANIDLGVNEYKAKEEKNIGWSTQTVDGFGEILEWCEGTTGDNDTFLPSPSEFITRYQKLPGLQKKNNTVLVFLSNYNWQPTMVGLLQRMYSPFFKTTIFCGTWTDPSDVHGNLPPIEPWNFVNITPEEMRNGHSYGYCVSKIKDLRLQNVTGYYFVADDTVFNIWHDIPQEKLASPENIVGELFWWRPEEIRRSYDLFEGKYKDHPRIGKSWTEYKSKIQKMHSLPNVTDYYLKVVRKILADFIYIPSDTLEYFGNLMEVLVEAEVFVEVAFGLAMDGLDYDRVKPFKYLWHDRAYLFVAYNSDLIGMHPMKLGSIHNPGEEGYRKQYCETVIRAFGTKIYGQMK